MQSKEASTDIVYKKKKRLAKSGKDTIAVRKPTKMKMHN